jgi:hypothetical protein
MRSRGVMSAHVTSATPHAPPSFPFSAASWFIHCVTHELPRPPSLGPLSMLRQCCRYRPAVAQVFGRTMLCKDIHVAGQASRAANINCVTLDGDQVRFRVGWGEMSGMSGMCDVTSLQSSSTSLCRRAAKRTGPARFVSSNLKTSRRCLSCELMRVTRGSPARHLGPINANQLRSSARLDHPSPDT